MRSRGSKEDVMAVAVQKDRVSDDIGLDRNTLVDRIRRSIIGEDAVMEGPFGPRRMVYADYTASGRSLTFIEDYIRDEVMPFYANTHTETSGTGLQTTRMREDARAFIRDAVGGTEEDVVIFSGSGATGAIDRMLGVLNLRTSPRDEAENASLEDDDRPVVFVGPYEHHANEVPWRFSRAHVVAIPLDETGHIDLEVLERELIRHRHRDLRIGSFSAASNVTGIITDTWAVATLLHRYGALSFWDFAAGAPYLDIDMNPRGEGVDPALAYKDAVFISPHKFIGGPGTPGVLVAKRCLFNNSVPVVPAGGTVSYVSRQSQDFVADPEHREEGGTPAIIESIRAGLVFQVKEAVGVKEIRRREGCFARRAIDRWRPHPDIWLLGNLEVQRLAIISFLIRYRPAGTPEPPPEGEDPGGPFLHWNYVVALLNDLFGIQARGGCSCAGPYGHRLFGIDEGLSQAYRRQIRAGYDGIKPGWARVSFNYFTSETAFDYVIEAVRLVAESGWKLLPEYRFCPRSGGWFHRTMPSSSRNLRDPWRRGGLFGPRPRRRTMSESILPNMLQEAKDRLEQATLQGLEPPRGDMEPLPRGFEALRWFPLPKDVLLPNPSGPPKRPEARRLGPEER